MESARTRDGGKETETKELRNGFDKDPTKQMPNIEKRAQTQSISTSVLESVSGEFALVISGHSLVSDSCFVESDLYFVKKVLFSLFAKYSH